MWTKYFGISRIRDNDTGLCGIATTAFAIRLVKPHVIERSEKFGQCDCRYEAVCCEA
jgi:hypothetical protein